MQKLDSKQRIMQKWRTQKDGQQRQEQSKLITGIIAVLFIGSGIVLGSISEHYGEVKRAEAQAAVLAIKQEEETSAPAIPETEEESRAPEPTEESETEKQPEPYEPAPDKLNLAYYYPEDAPSEEIIDSYAGQVFQELTVMDLDWLSDLYELSDISPSKMASRLGKNTKAIMGSYNPRDKSHKANNPSSWVIHDWKKIHVQFVNGDGKSIDAVSNVKDILSMASVYTYYTDMMDVDTFAAYSRQLWKNSHSYSLSMGDLYYCSGCLNKTEEELVREAEEDELSAGRAPFDPSEQIKSRAEEAALQAGYIGEEGVGGFVQGNAGNAGNNPTPEYSGQQTEAAATADNAAGSSDSWAAEAAEAFNSFDNVLPSAETAGIPEPEQASAESISGGNLSPGDASLGSDSTAADITEDPGNLSNISNGEFPGTSEAVSSEVLETEILETETAANLGIPGQTEGAGYGSAVSGQGAGAQTSSVSGSVLASASQNFQGNGVGAQGMQEAPESDGNFQDSDSAKKGKKTQYDCPGHVDLYIRVKILGLNEKKGLFSISRAAEKKEWEGWTEENSSSVKKISSQDWFADYGLSVSSFSLSTPLTNQEIEQYMNSLPADTSVTRRNIIHFALSSVGRVPYYWGGKASSPGYEGNNFGALIPADDKGRMLKGLDCSGWVSWVYWSATGKRLAGESTSSLCLSGRQISRKELKPGDIIVRTGTGAHVVMFLSWSADGRMNVIHESSTSMNNVSITTMDAPWPYYRKLVE